MARPDPTAHPVPTVRTDRAGATPQPWVELSVSSIRKRQQNPTLEANDVFLSQFSSQLVNYVFTARQNSGEAVSPILDFLMLDMLN